MVHYIGRDDFIANKRALGRDLMVHYIGRDDFIANKRALGRKKDIADLEAIGED